MAPLVEPTSADNPALMSKAYSHLIEAQPTPTFFLLDFIFGVNLRHRRTGG